MNPIDAPSPETAPDTPLRRRDLLASALGIACLAATNDAASQSVTDMPASSRELWQWARTQPVLEPYVAQLDTASGGPTLRAAMATEYRAREQQTLQLATRVGNGYWGTESTRLATRFGQWLGCDADELVFTRGAGEALAIVANGLDLAGGDEVLTTTREHPAALSPWLVQARRRGIVVKQIALPAPLAGPEQALGLLAGAITDRTRALMFSHVNYADGTLMPVRELCQFARSRNIVTVVDGAQAVGMLDFLVRDLDCDCYAASFHKWVNGSHGTGALFIKREMLDRLWPSAPRGLDAVPPIDTPTQAPGFVDAPAALHRMGNIVPLVWPALRGSEAAIEFQQQIGRSRIEARIRELAIYARLRLQQLPGADLLTPARPGLWGGIVTLRLPGRPADMLANTLVNVQRVYARAIKWSGTNEGALRVSLHIHNTHDEIDKLLLGLQQARL